MSPRVAIAGGGIIGLSIAWKLAQRGCEVTVYEAARAGGEATWAAAGMLAPGGEFDSPSRLADLALKSRAVFPSLVRELQGLTGLSIDYQECGGLSLAYSDQELASLEAKAARQAGMGIASKPVALEHVKAFWPRVRTESLAGARFYPADAVVNPRELFEALRLACAKAGVTVRENSAVMHVDVGADWVEIQRERFDAAVIAAGAWSSRISVHALPPLPESEPVKGHLIGYQQPAQTANTIVRREHTYLVQRANGLLVVGSSAERVGFNREVDAAITDDLARKAGFLFPHLAETSPAERWIGFRPASDDLHLGPWHSHRLHLAYGHFRNGILLAPVTADLVAESVISSLERSNSVPA